MSPRLRNRLASALLAAPLLAACASTPEIPDVLIPNETAAEENTPLGGEALGLRKRELERARRDMRHFHATLESLHERGERSGIILFNQYLDRYMGIHLAPLLRGEWQSRHPELMAVDANLRLTQADVLIQMRAPRRVQEVIDELERRFAGRGSMLVEYPPGGQTTLEDALQILRERKWRG